MNKTSALQPLLLIVLLSVACAWGGPVIVVHAFKEGLPGVRASNPDVRLRIDSDPGVPGETLLVVDYPAAGDDPAGRDVQCAAENRDWSGGRAIAFQIKPSNPIRVSVSFVDRNQVVYTSWVDLQGGVWRSVRLPFEEMRPNAYFQPPGAKTGAPIDVSDVTGIAFAPQDRASGRLLVGRFVVVK
jgi:hypothetical protein